MSYLNRTIADLLRLREQEITINHHEGVALLALMDDGEMMMSELGDRVPLSRAAITALTDRLEHIGLVFRTPDRADRRRVLLALTKKGRKTMNDVLSDEAEG